MKAEIVQFVKKACARYKLEAYYIPEGDVYVLTRKGRAVQNFNTEQFYQYPRQQRMKEYRALIAAMQQNLGESYKDQIFLPRKFGVRIV